MKRKTTTFDRTIRTVIAGGLVAAAALAGAVSVRAASVADIAMMTGPDRQAKLEAGAKAEGKLTFYTALIVNQAVRPLKAAFEKKYPYIEFEYIRSNTSGLLQRLMSEARARSNHADVVVASTAAGLKRAHLLQAFKSPTFSAYPKDYIEPHGLWATIRFSYNGIAYNTKLVSKADAPKTWEDVLDPKWKGKMVWAKSLETGGPLLIAHLRTIWGEKKAEAYFAKLAKQKVAAASGSIRSVLDLVIAGEYPIMLSAALHHVVISQGKGAPIDFSSPDPVIARPDHVQLMKTAPHPHAAMLFIDFLLSKQGQEILRKARYVPARPDVQPLPVMRPIVPQLNGKSQRIYGPAKLMDMQKKTMEIFHKTTR